MRSAMRDSTPASFQYRRAIRVHSSLTSQAPSGDGPDDATNAVDLRAAQFAARLGPKLIDELHDAVGGLVARSWGRRGDELFGKLERAAEVDRRVPFGIFWRHGPAGKRRH